MPNYQGIKNELKIILEKVLEDTFGQPTGDLVISYPPNAELGDFSVSCFELSQQLNLSPSEVAQKLRSAVKDAKIIESAESFGPYLNIKIKNSALFGNVLKTVIKEKDEYAESSMANGQKVVVEYLGPNTNKPLHLGHARNGALGMAVSQILEAAGYDVVKANLVNDRGIHICKSMLAWQKWAEGTTPESAGMKGDHFVGMWYVRYAKELEKNPELEQEVREMLQKWESGDKEIRRLWKKMNDWVLQGFEETYRRYGLIFDKTYFESETYLLGKKIVEQGLEKKIFYQDESGAVIFELPEKFGKAEDGSAKKITLIRADGTSVYITQDLGLAVKRAEDYRFDKMIYVVGSEQIFHFQSLFSILEALNYPWAGNLAHLSYGMVNLPEGKMKSREGKVVDTDDLIDEMMKLAREEVKKRDAENKLAEKEIAERAQIIGIGAIKFYLLKIGSVQNITFNPEESISFDGTTGPYCQYAYARIQSILRKAGAEKIKEGDIDYSLLQELEERILVQKLILFPEELEKSAERLDPSIIANLVYETAKAFNQFYTQHPVIASGDEKLTAARLALIHATAVMLKKSLNLLGIEVLEKM